MDLLVIDVVRDQGPDILSMCTRVRRRHRELALRRLEQHIHRPDGLLQQFAHRSPYGRAPPMSPLSSMAS